MEFTYDQWETGSDPVHTTTVTIAAGQNLPAKTPLGQVKATGEFKAVDLAANDGSQVATRMTAFAVDTTAGAKQAAVYKSGSFNPELVNWHASFDTAAKKATAFVGTPISLQLPRAV